MSDPSANRPPDHPWAKYYQERDKSRPPITELPRTTARPPGAEPSRPVQATASSPTRVSREDLEAEEANSESGRTPANPAFLSAPQREERELTAQRRRGRAILSAGALGLAGLVALHFLVLRTVVREPSPERLQQVAAALAPQVLRLHSSPDQPLEVVNAHAGIAIRHAADDLGCQAEITLRLREPLFAPADSNGTELYRSHAAAIVLAEAEAARRGLYADGKGPVPPLLPKVLRTAHRAGETLTVKIPFRAQRFGWSWSCQPPDLDRQTLARTLIGSTLAQQGSGPVLLLDSPNAQAGIRELTRAAKDYLEQINRDLAAQPVK